MTRYFYTAPSYYGMGSDRDTFYLTGAQMLTIIRRELANKANGKGYDERLIGKDDCPGDEEQIITRMLNQKRTYAPWPDLIDIPDDVLPKTERFTFEHKIFLTENEFLVDFEIYVGRIEFVRHVFELPDTGVFGALKERGIRAFAGFAAHNILVDCWDAAEDLRDYIERQRKKGRNDNVLDILEKKIQRPVEAKTPDRNLFIDVRFSMEPDALDEYLSETADFRKNFLRLPIQLYHDCMSMTYDDTLPHYYHPDEMFEAGADVEAWPIDVRGGRKAVMRKSLSYAFQN